MSENTSDDVEIIENNSNVLDRVILALKPAGDGEFVTTVTKFSARWDIRTMTPPVTSLYPMGYFPSVTIFENKEGSEIVQITLEFI
ncbi:hypothetical protein CEXT_115501 [Caerostris extrusa]|uniref:Uncharacterized protein n=1 Tax=Caerostris extrusa TaxID=172846 RepID=A0AAV4SN56_CAEEX|nr:hypothetical protein CEXT_115501 [Caerostris extrusa]